MYSINDLLREQREINDRIAGRAPEPEQEQEQEPAKRRGRPPKQEQHED
jgi:hypothetical protein